ncbi:MAG: glycosyltransferase, partial [Clostridiales bacterium]
DAEVVVADIYETAFPDCYDMVYMLYSSLVGKGGMLYNWAYNKTVSNKKEGDAACKNPITNHMLKRLDLLLNQLQPDVVIATYSLCAHLMSLYKCLTGDKVPLITCITDVTTHNVWINEETDLYMVAARCTQESLLAQGIPAARIAVTGIPVKSKFQTPFSLAADGGRRQRELLIMGGGLGLLPTDKEFYEALNQMADLHTTIITGKNEKLLRKLAGKYQNIQVLGFTDQVDQYMRRADLMITKPGGISMFEAIHSELPMLIFRPFLEQEIKNGEYIEANGLGVVLEKEPENAMTEIKDILQDQALLQQMKDNMHRVKLELDPQALIRFLTLCETKNPNRERVA